MAMLAMVEKRVYQVVEKRGLADGVGDGVAGGGGGDQCGCGGGGEEDGQ